MTYAELVAEAVSVLSRAGLPAEENRGDATVLARALLDWDAATWLARAREEPTPDFRTAFAAAVDRRRRREPVAYILGRREFYGRMFCVTRDVLIPRPETELVVDHALAAIARVSAFRPAGTIVAADIGTGSGCIAITIALEAPGTRVVATDISRAALAIARENAVRLDAASVSFHHTAFLDGVTDRFSVVMSNPPYVADTERSRMLPDVVAYEPHGALFAGDDGLDVFRLLLPKAVAALEDGGWLVLEIGHDQRHAISDLAEAEGLTEILVVADLAGRDRVLVARKPPASL